jgi:chemotaxis protein CheD
MGTGERTPLGATLPLPRNLARREAGQLSAPQGDDSLRMLAVDIADLKISTDPGAVLVTYALGSCIGLMVHDPVRKIAGLIHYMLPTVGNSTAMARQRPAMYADTGIPLLFNRMYSLGCTKADLVVKVAGGGALHQELGIFAIGQRNHTTLCRILGDSGITIAAEDVGGALSRTVHLWVATGRCTVTSHGREKDL